MRDQQQVVCTACGIFGPQGRGHDGHIVNTLGFYQRWQDAGIRRQPVLIGVDRVVEADQCFGTRLANLKLNRQHAYPGSRHRVHVFHTLDFGKHLFKRRRDQILDIARTGAGEADKHIRKGNVNLRFFLAWRY